MRCVLIDLNIYFCCGNNVWSSGETHVDSTDHVIGTHRHMHTAGDIAWAIVLRKQHKCDNNIFLPKQGEWNKLHEENSKQFSENELTR